MIMITKLLYYLLILDCKHSKERTGFNHVCFLFVFISVYTNSTKKSNGFSTSIVSYRKLDVVNTLKRSFFDICPS